MQAGYHLGFNSTSIVTLRPEELMVDLEDSEFRSLSFHFSLSNITNSAILHLISTTTGQVVGQTIVTALKHESYVGRGKSLFTVVKKHPALSKVPET